MPSLLIPLGWSGEILIDSYQMNWLNPDSKPDYSVSIGASIEGQN